jgi:large subunit ribosomal protein L4
MPERRKKKNLKSTKHHAARKTKAVVSKKTVKPKKTGSAKKAAESKASKDGVLPVYELNGKSTESVTLDPLFQDAEVNRDVVYQAVLMYQAGGHGGTAATKTRGEVSGGGKKPWKQKGTGRARHASIRSPIWRGGGTVFGPHPRDYSYQLPLHLRRKAVVEGVKDKILNGKLVMVKDLEVAAPKTKLMAGILSAFKLEKPLFLVDKKTDNLVLASRNLKQVYLKTAEEVNVLDVVSHRECVMTKAAYTGLLKRLKS